MQINIMSKEKLVSEFDKVLLKLANGEEVKNATLEKLLCTAMEYVK